MQTPLIYLTFKSFEILLKGALNTKIQIQLQIPIFQGLFQKRIVHTKFDIYVFIAVKYSFKL